MTTLRLSVGVVVTCSVFALTGCGNASVSYGDAQPSNPNNAQAIENAASDGKQPVTLPITRLIIAQTQPGNANQPQNSPDPPPANPSASHVTPSHPTTHSRAAANSGNGSHAPVTPAVGGGAVTPATVAPKNDSASITPATGVSGLSTILAGDAGSFTVTASQIEGSNQFTAAGENDFFSENDFGITYVQNTRIPTTVSNTFTDQTATRIKAIAGIASALIPLAAEAEGAAASASPCANVGPVTLDITANQLPNSWTAIGKSGATVCYTVSVTRADYQAPPEPVGGASGAVNNDPFAGYTPREKNLVRAPALLSNLASTPQLWPVPACLQVNVVITAYGSNSTTSGQLTVIDPDYLSVMPVPNKGKIAMHPICGADLSDSPDDKWGTIFDSMSAIQSAIPSAKK